MATIVLVGFVAISGAYCLRFVIRNQALRGEEAPPAQSLEEIKENVENIGDGAEVNPEFEVTEIPTTPSSLNISLPFFSQAPFGNWDYPWQETCEEASVLLVANLYNHMNLNAAGFNDELLRLVDWETEYFGDYRHTTVAQTAEMLDVQYGLKTVVHENPTFEEIQGILNNGNFIIAPFAGKLLGNPNFRNGGPNYHMLVIKGYDADKNQIVTNDVGTRNGADFVYNWDTIETALHDWHDTDILLGEKKIIEVLSPSM